MRPYFTTALLALVSAAALACADTTDPTLPVVESIRLQPAAVVLVIGETRASWAPAGWTDGSRQAECSGSPESRYPQSRC